jgi:cytochrome c oxidase cbb3-type subunit I/II
MLKFMVVALTCYGMSTFEGPMLSLKSINAVAHYTDWIVAHVHVGGLGWNGMLTFGILYWLIPRLYQTKLHSSKMASFHFWIATLGILFYAIPMYWAGFTQYFMWQEFTADGVLKYPNFLETVTQIMPMYKLRAFGGALYLVGAISMVYNLVMTMKAGVLNENEATEAPALEKLTVEPAGHWHRWIERRPIQMLLIATVVILIGGLVEMIPTFMISSNIPTITVVKPYTPLELQGRDLYIRDGCYTCHSQMIRPFRHETERYGEYAKAGEFIYDHPFQWGSKRTGPDLLREGGKYPNLWHYHHMIDPTTMSPGSIMPAYDYLADNDLDTSSTGPKIRAMISLGVPYPKGYDQIANQDLMKQANEISADLKKNGAGIASNKELVAMIAYLQRLGTDIKANKTEVTN